MGGKEGFDVKRFQGPSNWETLCFTRTHARTHAQNAFFNSEFGYFLMVTWLFCFLSSVSLTGSYSGDEHLFSQIEA